MGSSKKSNVRTDEPPGEDIANWYGHLFRCDNCQRRNDRFVRKGIRAHRVIVICDKCGCRIQRT